MFGLVPRSTSSELSKRVSKALTTVGQQAQMSVYRHQVDQAVRLAMAEAEIDAATEVNTFAGRREIELFRNLFSQADGSQTALEITAQRIHTQLRIDERIISRYFNL